MSSKTYKNAKAKRDGGAFALVPKSVLDGKAYLSVSAHARMLLWDLFSQFNGGNNGDLCAAFSVLKSRGWKSQNTLHAAKQELLDAGLIAETRKGGFPNRCSLYGVTWHALDDCGSKLDIKPCAFPRGAYRLKDPVPQLKKITPLNASAASTAPPQMH